MYNDLNTIAQNSANTFKNSLQYLVDAQNQQKLLDQQAATQRYQNLLTQINQQRTPIQQQFESDAQSAYINKMLAGKQINQNLNQIGLNTQGFGVSQQGANEIAYGQNYNQLVSDKSQAFQNIDNQITNAAGEYAANQTSLDATYAGRLTDLQKYIGEQTQNQYNTTYSQLTDAKKYQDQLAQQAWENEYKNRTLSEEKRQANMSYSSGTSGFNNTATTPTANTTTATNTKTYKDTDKVNTNYSATLSSRAAEKWLDNAISKQVVKNKGIKVGDLKLLLQDAYNKKTINEDDVKRILKSFKLS